MMTDDDNRDSYHEIVISYVKRMGVRQFSYLSCLKNIT